MTWVKIRCFLGNRVWLKPAAVRHVKRIELSNRDEMKNFHGIFLNIFLYSSSDSLQATERALFAVRPTVVSLARQGPVLRGSKSKGGVSIASRPKLVRNAGQVPVDNQPKENYPFWE